MPNGLGYSPNYYGTAQPVSFLDNVGSFFGNLGNNWQGGSDAPMYGGNTAGLPYATVEGTQNAGQAAGEAINTVVQYPVNFLIGLARGGGAILGVAVIVMALANESSHSGRRA